MPDFEREPWRHPACWKAHLVHNTLGHVAGHDVAIAKCQCGWSVTASLDADTRRAFAAQAVATNDHWRSVIAEADAEAVPA